MTARPLLRLSQPSKPTAQTPEITERFTLNGICHNGGLRAICRRRKTLRPPLVFLSNATPRNGMPGLCGGGSTKGNRHQVEMIGISQLNGHHQKANDVDLAEELRRLARSLMGDSFELKQEQSLGPSDVCDSVDRHNRQRVKRARAIDHSVPIVVGHLLKPYLHDRRSAS